MCYFRRPKMMKVHAQNNSLFVRKIRCSLFVTFYKTTKMFYFNDEIPIVKFYLVVTNFPRLNLHKRLYKKPWFFCQVLKLSPIFFNIVPSSSTDWSNYFNFTYNDWKYCHDQRKLSLILHYLCCRLFLPIGLGMSETSKAT